MCELLGMNANVPTDICFSFTGLMQRGGKTGPHKDGWGIAFYEGNSVREFRDPYPSSDSEIAKLIQHYPIKSTHVISHIRQANVGKVSLENTHPFIRELWGRHWTYAHNGQMKEVFDLPLGASKPVGTTDSEHAFCWLLDEIRQNFPDKPEQQQSLFQFIHNCCNQLREYGIFNMLLSDAEFLYTYCSNKLHWITRRAPFGEANLADTPLAVNFKNETSPSDIVSVIATTPLTDNERWNSIDPGQLLVLKNGIDVYYQ